MKLKKHFIFLSLFALLMIFASGCTGETTASTTRYEMGGTNEEYQGVVNPTVPQKLKLSETEIQDYIKTAAEIKAKTGGADETGEIH